MILSFKILRIYENETISVYCSKSHTSKDVIGIQRLWKNLSDGRLLKYVLKRL